jgi:flagellar biogenesis protein FliO
MMDGTLSLITALVGIILSLVFFGLLYRRKQKHSHIINLVAYHSFGAKKGIAALQIGKEILVVGVTPSGFNVMKTLPVQDVMDKKEEVHSETRKSCAN